MDTKKLLAEIRQQTGIQLDADDPLMAAVFINERLLDAALADLRKVMTRCMDQMAAQTVQNEESAKKVAAKIITDAATWIGEQFQDAAKAASEHVLSEVRGEIRLTQKARKQAMAAAYVAIGGSAVSVIVAVGLAVGIV